MAAIAKGTPVKFIYSATAASVPATPSAGVFYVFQNGDLWLNTDGTASGNVQIGIPKSREITAGDGLAGGGALTDDVTLSHSTAAGYKHIPAGGAAGNILVYGGSAGTAAWAEPTTLSVSHAATAGSADEADHAGSADTATTANKTQAAITIKLNGGTTEGTNQFVFDGSTAKTINITPAGIGAALASHNHDDVYAPVDHTHVVDDITGFPDTLPCTGTLTISGTAEIGTFDGSANETITITPANIGAAAASHTHSQYATTTALESAQSTLQGSITTLQGQAALKGYANTFTAANTFNGAVTVPAPTADNHATTRAYVDSKINSAIAAQNAMVFKGIINATTALPTTGYKVGWTYYVGTAGTYAGDVCEVGDMIICVKSHATGASNADWNVVQTNINGAVVGATDLTANQVVVGNGSKNVKILAAGTNGHVLTMVSGAPAWQAPGHVQPATVAPKAPATAAAVGTSLKYAREDHVHPLQTTVTTASKLSTASAGSSTNPVYFANGIPVASAVKPTSIVPKVAGTAAAGSSNEYARADHVHPVQTTVATATKLGTATVGSASIPIYLNAGTPTACTSLVIDDGDLDAT